MHRTFLTLTFFAAPAFALTGPSFPILTYSTYLRENFTPKAIAADSTGNIYLTGDTIVNPTNSQTAVLVLKLNPRANQYLYTRYLNGSVNDHAYALALDSAGNAYVAGETASPDFPVTSGGNLQNSLASNAGQRSFVTKLDANGDIVFSDVFGGPAASMAQAIALNAAGQIIVSGVSLSQNFPSTPGAYSIANTINRPYLAELDPTGSKVIFSATGIGGTSVAIDAAGNIYVAGTTELLDYPTTPGAYQSAFPVFSYCLGPCPSPVQGPDQYVTKVDPTGAKLIYSTSLSGSGNTTNNGLAVDAAGNAYVTGYAGASYPYTFSPVPALSQSGPGEVFALPFLSKLDPTGATLLFSAPVGGAGVDLDANGNVYVGGGVGSSPGGVVPASVPAVENVPQACMPRAGQLAPGAPSPIQSAAYAAQVDAATGNVRGTQFIGGSSLTVSSVALAGTSLWMAGATLRPDFPFTSGTLAPQNFSPVPTAGAYLGAADFSQPAPPPGTPQIACILDAASLAPAGPMARYQLVSIFGSGLGPTPGVNASSLTYSLAGSLVSFTGFGGSTAPLLYVSTTQINLAVPLLETSVSLAPMFVSVNGVSSAPLAIPLTYASPSLFVNLAATYPSSGSSPGAVALALNADGSLNSAANPAQPGAAISVFVNGLTPDPEIVSAPTQLFATNGWVVTGIAQATQYVTQVNLQVPASLLGSSFFSCMSTGLCAVGFTLNMGSGDSLGAPSLYTGESFGGVVYVNRGQ